MGLFDERVSYKPFQYPQYYTDGWLPQAQAFWLHTEISMQSDVKDFKEHLTPAERNLVGNILLGFAQTETAVGDYWTSMVTKWFPKHEIKQMAMMFGSQETIHAAAYSYLNETLGLEDFEAFSSRAFYSCSFRKPCQYESWLRSQHPEDKPSSSQGCCSFHCSVLSVCRGCSSVFFVCCSLLVPDA